MPRSHPRLSGNIGRRRINCARSMIPRSDGKIGSVMDRDRKDANIGDSESMVPGFDRTSTALPNAPKPIPAAEHGISAYQLTADDVRHITLGEPDGQGGHLCGTGREGKTEFPEDWDSEKCVAAVQEVFDGPQHASTFSVGDGETIVRYGIVDGVLIIAQTHVRGSVEFLVQSFPLGGTGVKKNVGGVPVEWGWDKVPNKVIATLRG